MLIYILYYAIILGSYYIFCVLRKYTFRFYYSASNKNYGSTVVDHEGRNKKIYICLMIGLLIVIFGLRAQTMGVDLKGYLSSFERLNQYSWNEIIHLESYLNYEKGYVIFNKLVGSIWYDRQFFLFVCAAVSLIPIGIISYKYSSNQLLTILVYMGLPVFLINYSALRQAIAVGITVLAFVYIKERKLLKFVLMIVFASIFHSSAFVFLIAYPLYGIKLNDHMAYFSIGIPLLVYLLRYPIFKVISRLFKENAVPDNNNAINLFLVLLLIYLFCVCWGDRNNEKVNGLSNIFLVACACQAMGGVHSLAVRVGYYFMLPLCILLPEVLKEMRVKQKFWRVLITWILGAIFLCYGLYSIKNGSWAMSYPYKFFWENVTY